MGKLGKMKKGKSGMAQPVWVGGLQAWGGVSLAVFDYSSYTSQSNKVTAVTQV